MKESIFEQDFEYRHLAQTVAIAQEQLVASTARNEENKEAILAAKRELRENTAHSVANLWSMENFHDLVELSQYANPVLNNVAMYEREAGRILTLERIINSPYFARIDFRADGGDTFEKIYIGLSTLRDDDTYEIYIYDWRSPLASVFYRFSAGKVFYEAPGGKITGEVCLKRQYEIKNGELLYFFDADVQIIDDFLRKLLSQNASPQMKTIVETIQKDQDIIIRDMEADLVMVQGCAGSGKTSVALHRAAYLMYQGLAAKLSNTDIAILSPNTLFAKYISNVLPELGESNVNSLVFEDLLRFVLPRAEIQTKNEFLEALLSPKKKASREILKASMAFKGSPVFVEILNRFVRDLPHRWITFEDIYYDKEVLADRQLLKAKVLRGNKHALLAVRLQRLEETVLEAVHARRSSRLDKLRDRVLAMKQKVPDYEVEETARMLSIHESTMLIRKIRKFTVLDCRGLYRELFSRKSRFYDLARGLPLPAGLEEIIDFTCENLKKEPVAYDDALALAYLNLKTKGVPAESYKGIKQVVVDEAQDYHPLHYEILNTLFPQARYTILGDINQTVGKTEDLALYEQITKILNKEKSAFVTLDKSFRCTREILQYSAKFLAPGLSLNSFSRAGDPPAVLAAPDQPALDGLIIAEINTCREKNYQSIGLICKTEQDAVALYSRLKDKVALQLIKKDGETDLSGALVLPVYMAKGLEFDAVLVCDADREHFHSEDDRNLLYIACTRALHRLNLFYTGEISRFLQ